MSALDPREVLLYLNELGYTNITAKQLKEFMKDLKKLIKYEQRKEQRRIKPPLTSTIPELSKFTKVESYLYSTSTVSSKAKEVKPKENIITVEVKRNRPRVSENEPAKTNAGEVNKEKETNASEVTKDENPKSLGKLSEKSQAISRPTTSFIRPKAPLKKTKSDPVTLYHQYQAQWRKIKFPGDDRSELRWAIREKMMGDNRPMSVATSVNNARRRQNLRNI